MSARRLAIEPAARDLLAAARALLSRRVAYLVGGSLRDMLLRHAITDLDLVVSGDAPSFARTLADRLEGHLFPLDPERGTSRVSLDEGPVRAIDVSPLRGDIERDLAARDYTVDAIAASLDALDTDDPALIDPAGGLSDLDTRIVRLVSEQALVEDPLRLLRGIRLAVQLDFDIEPSTASALRRHAPRIAAAAMERQRDELMRCLATDRAARAVRLLDQAGLLDRILPEVAEGRGVPQPKEHFFDVLGHAVETVAALDAMLAAGEPEGARQRDVHAVLWQSLAFLPGLRADFDGEVREGRSRGALLKLAGLLHDVAKPQTRAPDDTGRIRFFGHAERGAETARRILRRLRFSRHETGLVALMVEEHLRPGQLSQQGPPSRRALYRFFRDTGEAAEGVLLLSLADALAARGPRMTLDAWRGHVAYIAHILSRRDEDETIARPQRLVTGDDIMVELGIGPGPEVGRLLADLEEAIASGDVVGREAALAFVRARRPRNARASLARIAATKSRVGAIMARGA